VQPFRTFGYVPGENERYRDANQLDNLVTLCASCHRRVEASVVERSALAGLATVLANLAPLTLMCSRSDLGVSAEAVPAGHGAVRAGRPTIFLYDQVPGGVGYSAALFDQRRELLAAAHELVSACACERGCPACIGPVLEEDMHDVKADTLRLIAAIVG
jgi:DEAD/DEAH box helicase domain-containing protein